MLCDLCCAGKTQGCLCACLVPQGVSVVILTVDSAFYEHTCLSLAAVTKVRRLPKSLYLQVYFVS